MKKRFSFLIMTVTVLCALFSFTASADTGPKPSVNISFENMGDEVCYGTLLSLHDSWGPARVWNGKEAPDYYVWESDKVEYKEENGAHKDIWQKMVDYEDNDGYYFLQRIWRIDGNNQMNWTYYPPNSFKILLYYPESNCFVSSGIYERYAFDSYYTVNMQGINIQSVTGSAAFCGTDLELEAEKSYDYTWETISLIARIIITLAIETIIALLFAYKGKREFTIIFAVNIITQILLNVALNIENFKEGYMAFTVYYIFFEIIIFAVESAIYSAFIKDKKRSRNILLALVSNISSFVGGLVLAHIIPGIF